MTKYNDSEYFINPQEEIDEREVREGAYRADSTEIRRIQTGEADDDIVREDEQHTVEERSKRPRWMGWIIGVITGDILLANAAKRVYTLLTILGIIFFTSITTIFASLHSDLRCNKLEKEIALLKERAIRLSEQSYQLTSHSAILRQLESRGIELSDPTSQPKLLK
uniref:hypothetical protein n=1 Tax=Alistipes sp. TaxID=1872444 RepID=UPI004056D3C7